jgi:hypothetical protein
MYQMAELYSKLPKNRYTDLFHSKALQNLPKLGISVRKYTIWQTWCTCCWNDVVLRKPTFLHIYLLRNVSEAVWPDWAKFRRLGDIFRHWVHFLCKISSKIHQSKGFIFVTFCLISLGKKSYLVRLHLRRFLTNLGDFFTNMGDFFSQNVWSHCLEVRNETSKMYGWTFSIEV